jgi:hypothetical protein
MLKKILCGATLLCAATLSNAGTIVQDHTIVLQTTNFQKTITFAKFDDLGGSRILQSVSFSIDGSIAGSAAVESKDNGAATLTTTLSAELSLKDPLNNVLVVVIPSVINIFEATPFDGVNDFGGTSGISYPDLMASEDKLESYIDLATRNLFTGSGMTVNLLFDATAKSKAGGAGNIVSQFSTQAEGFVEIVYTYTLVPVSAPSHVALLGLGLIAFGGVKRLRK